MIRSTFLIILIVLPSVATALDDYPRWFLYPSEYPDLVTGFSYGGYDPVVDAERMVCVYRECIVDGSLDQYLHYDKRNSDYYYTFDADELESVKGTLIPQETFFINMLAGDMITAFSSRSIEFSEEPFLSVDSLIVPAWLENPFERRGGYYYGTGFYTSRSNKNDAWKTAEEKAFFSIMNGLVTQIFAITTWEEHEGGAQFSTLHSNRLKGILSGLEVVERYPDNENQLFYVRARIPVSGIFIPSPDK